MLQVIEWQRIASHIIVFVLRLLVKREYASQPLVIYLRNLTLPKKFSCGTISSHVKWYENQGTHLIKEEKAINMGDLLQRLSEYD